MDWIAVDWGTSSLRAWWVGHDGVIKDHRSSDQGMGTLSSNEFEPTLLGLIDDWLTPDAKTQVIACGMIGARQGWVEASYTPVPCTPSQTHLTTAPVSDPRIDVSILSGLSQTKPTTGVMRGEETQISGYLAQHPHFDGVICLPGTHTKWVHVSAGEVISFQTVMSGELFAAISQHTVLRHSVSGDDWDQDSFDTAVDVTLSRPAAFATELFSLRASDLVLGQSHGAARARLSGLLLGMELAATKPYWLGQIVILIGAPALCDLYRASLRAQGVMVDTADATTVTLAGLAAAYKHKFGTLE